MFEVRAFMIDLILIAVVAEFLLLRFLLKRRGQEAYVRPIFLFLASGAALLAAVRFALAPQQEAFIAPALLAALILHGACLVSAASRSNR